MKSLSLKEVRARVDESLETLFATKQRDAMQLDQRYARLWNAIATLVMQGGKRFRPYMVVLMASLYGDDTLNIDTILPAATAQELLHQAMLIHDDIIDRDTVRYGIANVKGQYDAHYAEYISDENERDHMSKSSALLAGDALISEAYLLLSTLDTPPHVRSAVTATFARGIFEVIGGELLDTEITFLPAGTLEVEKIARNKTASYSFVSPLTVGAQLGGAPEEDIILITQLATSLGIAYQYRDDLLGVFGDSDETGKSTSTDLTEGKRTLLIEQFDRVASDDDKTVFYQNFHSATTHPESIEHMRSLLGSSGAKKAVETQIDRLRQHTLDNIAQLHLPEEARQELVTLVGICLDRRA